MQEPIEINKKLSDKQKCILFERGTEPAFSGEFVYDKKQGIYKCANCGNALFSSDKKYDSKSGWPSFWEPISNDAIEYRRDCDRNGVRTEVICKKCKSHLGHVFDDGPKPTGQRFCINSLALAKNNQKMKNDV